MPVESRKAQLEAMQSSKQSDSERDSAVNATALSNPTTLARAAAPSANAGAAFAGVAEQRFRAAGWLRSAAEQGFRKGSAIYLFVFYKVFCMGL